MVQCRSEERDHAGNMGVQGLAERPSVRKHPAGHTAPDQIAPTRSPHRKVVFDQVSSCVFDVSCEATDVDDAQEGHLAFS